MMIVTTPVGGIEYPVSDGVPMADDGKQGFWITFLNYNLDLLFHDRPDVLIGVNQFWFPVEGEPGIRVAPDVYVAVGRPRGTRKSYYQWVENHQPPDVVFEVLSPSNTDKEMNDKFDFYDEHGAGEYVIIDPHRETLIVYERGKATLARKRADGYRSKALGIQFVRTDEGWRLRGRDGEFLLSGAELGARQQRERAEFAAAQDRAAAEARRATKAEQRAAAEKQRAAEAEGRATAAEQQAAAEGHRADAETQRATAAERRATESEQRVARLAHLTGRLLAGQITAEERAELQRLANG